MSINITFQAYIPKNLGKTLYELNTDLIDKSLLNYDDFVRKLKSFDTRPYRWIVEPGNLMNRLFCSTDTEDFHSRHTTLHTSRLGFTLNIDLHKIGKITITNLLNERPKSSELRLELGHWEADTVIGKQGKACILTLVDRKSRKV